MPSLADATVQALSLLILGDRDLWEIIGISFRVSVTAIAIAIPPALLTAFFLAHLEFPGRRVLISLFNTLLSLPAVVIGLVVYLLLSRQGPLGDWRLLFTQTAMVVAQVLLAFPILVALVSGLKRRVTHRHQNRKRQHYLRDHHGGLREQESPVAERALPRQQQVHDQADDHGRQRQQCVKQ